ncbi:hypothetical protein PILCRDRAFT_826524, partial [Piloderma croceum F 1598]
MVVAGQSLLLPVYMAAYTDTVTHDKPIIFESLQPECCTRNTTVNCSKVHKLAWSWYTKGTLN